MTSDLPCDKAWASPGWKRHLRRLRARQLGRESFAQSANAATEAAHHLLSDEAWRSRFRLTFGRLGSQKVVGRRWRRSKMLSSSERSFNQSAVRVFSKDVTNLNVEVPIFSAGLKTCDRQPSHNVNLLTICHKWCVTIILEWSFYTCSHIFQ